MTRRKKDPLRPLTEEERQTLEELSRLQSERADVVTRAKALLAVAQGASFTVAARAVGRCSGDAVAHLVSRFHREGLPAVFPRHAGGPPTQYGTAERERILREVRRPPDRERDGTATWSLTTLRRTLRQAPDGLPHVSTFTIHGTLREAGYTWQRSRTWCETGKVVRRRKAGLVTVTDPEAAPQKR